MNREPIQFDDSWFVVDEDNKEPFNVNDYVSLNNHCYKIVAQHCGMPIVASRINDDDDWRYFPQLVAIGNGFKHLKEVPAPKPKLADEIYISEKAAEDIKCAINRGTGVLASATANDLYSVPYIHKNLACRKLKWRTDKVDTYKHILIRFKNDRFTVFGRCNGSDLSKLSPVPCHKSEEAIGWIEVSKLKDVFEEI